MRNSEMAKLQQKFGNKEALWAYDRSVNCPPKSYTRTLRAEIAHYALENCTLSKRDSVHFERLIKIC